ncbi:MAG: gamma carbonic anhydrase family protein [Bacteroidales bacterium]
MALIKSVRGYTPKFGRDCFLADNATIVGDVTMGNDCTIWFNTVIRGDVNTITIGKKVNIQDNSVLHCLYKKSTIEIGDNVSIGHRVIVHGAKIHSNVLLGMGSIIMDDAVIEQNSIIAAGAVVLPNTRVEAGSIYAGIPAKRIKSVDELKTREMIEKIANNYTMYASWYNTESTTKEDLPEK